MTNLKTERLWLRPISISDLKLLHSHWADTKVRRYLWDDEVISDALTRDIIEQNSQLMAKQNFGLWGIREQGDHHLLGCAGFWYFRSPPERELIISVAPSHWQRGIGTEAGQCLLQYAFEQLDFASVQASTDLANQSSIQMLEKLGMTFQRRALVEGLDTLFYSISKQQWPTNSIKN